MSQGAEVGDRLERGGVVGLELGGEGEGEGEMFERFVASLNKAIGVSDENKGGKSTS